MHRRQTHRETPRSAPRSVAVILKFLIVFELRALSHSPWALCVMKLVLSSRCGHVYFPVNFIAPVTQRGLSIKDSTVQRS